MSLIFLAGTYSSINQSMEEHQHNVRISDCFVHSYSKSNRSVLLLNQIKKKMSETVEETSKIEEEQQQATGSTTTTTAGKNAVAPKSPQLHRVGECHMTTERIFQFVVQTKNSFRVNFALFCRAVFVFASTQHNLSTSHFTSSGILVPAEFQFPIQH